MSGTHKARIILTEESNWQESVIEVFRFTEAGWTHVADVANPDQLAELADLDTLTEFSPLTEEPERWKTTVTTAVTGQNS